MWLQGTIEGVYVPKWKLPRLLEHGDPTLVAQY